MITTVTSFSFHSHGEIGWNEYNVTDSRDTEQSISADTDYCSICLFSLKTDIVPVFYHVIVSHSSGELNIPDETMPFRILDYMIRDRSPPRKVIS